MSKKSLALLLAVALLIGGAVGGTIAWLTDTTEEVTNTFSVGNIDIELWEHELKNGALLNTGCPTNTQESEHHEVSNNAYKIIPGTEQPKDPFVRVKADSEDCYIFIQVQEVNNVAATNGDGTVTHKYVTWNIDTNKWTKLAEDTKNNVTTYYLKSNYTNKPTDELYYILSENEVSYGNTLTKEMIDKLYETDESGKKVIDSDKQPKLNFKAFAVQKEAAGTAIDAWGKIPKSEYLAAPATN